jgi:hypothetical protein
MGGPTTGVIEAATSKDISINLVRATKDDPNGTYLNREKNDDGSWDSKIVWDTELGLQTTDGQYIISPATALEHEFDHNLSFVKDTEGYRERAGYRERNGRRYSVRNHDQYGNQEEMRVITGSEARTARAHGEYPEGYMRPDHNGKWVKTIAPFSNYSPGHPYYRSPHVTVPSVLSIIKRMISITTTPPK